MEILVAVVKYKTKLLIPRQGLCSTWLSRLETGNRVPLWVRPGTLRFPSDPVSKNLQFRQGPFDCLIESLLSFFFMVHFRQKVPVIMIGPGTGCSPFRSYIDDQKDTDRQLCLFFGCRSSSGDFFFRDVWLNLQEQGRLQLFCAFSRDQPDKMFAKYFQFLKPHKLFLTYFIILL